MIKIMKDRWAKNRHQLREALSKRTDLNECDYSLLVRLTFENIFNAGAERESDKLDIKKITVIDDGDYQGTLLFLLPFNQYQPSEHAYLMTFVSYGSCSGCDTLLAIQDYKPAGDKLTERQLDDFMMLCKDIACNTIKPYNYGWRGKDEYLPVEMSPGR